MHALARGLFDPIFTSDEVAAATSDQAWLQAMLDVESELAAAEADSGLVPAAAAAAISAQCKAEHFDVDALGREARGGGNPVIPLVRHLRALLPEEYAGWVHYGTTSQDVLDSAAMVLVGRVSELVARDLSAMADAAAELARRHRSDIVAARTLLQHATPTTFGRKAAGWTVASLEAASQLRRVASERLAVQLGGSGGTLASLGPAGPAVTAALAARLGLAVPALPWHTDRARVAEVAAALGVGAGVAGKIALDVALLMQTEVAEAAEPAGDGWGISSSLPHKRNPAMAAAVLGSARRSAGLVAIVMASMIQEHERAVGAWQAEWQTLSELLAAGGGAVATTRKLLEGLELDVEQMAVNLGLTRGLVLSERISLLLAARIGATEARRVVDLAARRARQGGTAFRAELVSMPEIERLGLSGEQLDEWLDPRKYLGSNDAYIDRALELHRRASTGGGR